MFMIRQTEPFRRRMHVYTKRRTGKKESVRTHSMWRMRLRQRSSHAPSHWHSGPGSLAGGTLQMYLMQLQSRVVYIYICKG